MRQGTLFLIALLTLSNVVAQNSDPTGLTDAELAIEPPTDAQTNLEPVPADETTEYVIEGIVEFGYQDEQGRYFVDLLERDQAYVGVRISTPDGRPVVGATPEISIEGTSRLVRPDLSSAGDGVVNFGVAGGEMGLDRVTASLGEASVEFAINVISLSALGFPELEVVEGGIAWDELMLAQLDYKDMNLHASFPQSVQERAGTAVKLSGFMVPLQPEMKQTHFLLTSNPPSCFFHIPGGPAGAVEVLAPDGIEVSWDPVIIEGRFEPLKTSETGVVYRLHDAHLYRP